MTHALACSRALPLHPNPASPTAGGDEGCNDEGEVELVGLLRSLPMEKIRNWSKVLKAI
jgi:hypothetical protein